jgi:IclR family transcriptional regulator, KDG regulon repressor
LHLAEHVIYNGRVTQDISENLTGSIAHATDILICIGNDFHGLTDIARECNLGKSTVHRVLKLLEQSRFVVQDTINRRYYLGPLLTRLTSNPVTTHEYLIMYASEEMRRLSLVTEETVMLDIMIGTQSFSLFEVPSRHDLKVSQQDTMPGPLLTGASFKVLLSQLNDKQLNTALENITLQRPTERSVTDKEVLKNQIKETRQLGFTVSRGEWINGVMCISFPVINYTLPLSLNVVGPESRLRQREQEVIEEIKKSSSRISASILRIFKKPEA